jgi:prolyl-tRNA editing enzyme YbaK/EbsC (Cys-tRNA(Pro) deacylase)
MPTAIDSSLARFERLFAAAGHPHCVFATTVPEIEALTGGTVSALIATTG